MADRLGYRIDIGGCRYGHSNPVLSAFMTKYSSNRVPVKYPGHKPQVPGPSFQLGSK